MISMVEGKVVEVLERGFSLDTGMGEPTIVSTKAAGLELGLHPGDQVRVFGGMRNGDTFASAFASKILPSGEETKIPINEDPINLWQKPRKPWWPFW